MRKIKAKVEYTLRGKYKAFNLQAISFIRECLKSNCSMLSVMESCGIRYDPKFENLLSEMSCKDVNAFVCAFTAIDFWDEFLDRSHGSKMTGAEYKDCKLTIYYELASEKDKYRMIPNDGTYSIMWNELYYKENGVWKSQW